ncbi:battenin isoform X1 [Acipenser oxyrinchus oxyrinchus]|uniref:Battenin n=1 Tax=Acipenser oxyrinchus oxyrinchus TaxID=40147 RepID=A0AAD8FTZ0_ACIOX|nr:battenin isoform X1 [Acipenser oxyrinchus oxyrinchus]
MRRNDRSVNGSESDSDDDDNEVESHVASPSETQDVTTRWRNFAGFWLLGLCNNFAYVIMLSAAHDILSQQQAGTNTTLPTAQPTVLNGTDWELPSIAADNSFNTSRYDCNPVSTAAILLADILPTLVIKFSAPFFIHLIPYSIRVLLCSLTAAGSFIIVSFSTGIWMSILGVVFASVSSGLGELSFLGLSSFFHSSVISGWSSGTGGAGILGRLVLGLTQVGLSPKHPAGDAARTVLMMISYFGVLVHPPSLPGWSRKRAPPQTDREARRPLLDEEDHQEDITYTETLGLKEKVFIVRGLLKYMIPLAVVYFAEYFINQGLFELLYFPKSNLKHSAQYRWYQTLYQLGVFISRSSVNCLQIKKIWILAALQCVNALVLFLAVYYQFFPSIFIVFAFILYEGLLGGASYVNTFNNISRESSDSLREFSLGAACVSDTLGISLSGALAIPLHDYLCRLP